MCGNNSNTRSVSWDLPPDLQQKFDEVQAHIRRLQIEMGVEPKTIEQRHQDYLQRQAEEQRRQEELKKLEQRIGKHRPPPKWKV
jgi:hypothetical protein